MRGDEQATRAPVRTSVETLSTTIVYYSAASFGPPGSLIYADCRRLDLRRNERAVNQIFHLDRLFQYPGLQSHVVNLLQIFISGREHPIADAVGRLGQHVAHYLFILPEVRRGDLGRVQTMRLGPLTALGDTAHEVFHHRRSFLD